MAGILESLTYNLTITEHSDWERFVQRLSHLVQTGRVRRVTPTKRLKANDEEWYLDPETGDVYVYAPPDWPFLPSWEKVDAISATSEPRQPVPPQ